MRARLIPLLLLLLATLLASACATPTPKPMNALERIQYDYSAAIRWNDFEGAANVVDPELKAKAPITALEFERYKQIQVTGYTILAEEVAADESKARREIQISLINRHTMAERTVRYTELWRYDAVAKRWWLTSGLPDFWSTR